MAKSEKLRLLSLLTIAGALGAYWLNTEFFADDSELYVTAFQGGYLALDLDADGIETFAVSAGNTFDFLGAGLQTGTGWLRADDGFLVFDRNQNGQIDNAAELVGQDTLKADGTLAQDGFAALQDFDDNQDGIFDAQDAAFSQMQVWRDINADGLAQAPELQYLAQHRIKAIDLASVAAHYPSNDNRVTATSRLIRADLKLYDGLLNNLPAAFVAFVRSRHSFDRDSHQVVNLELRANKFYRRFLHPIALDESVKTLPDMYGSGAVRDLREACMLSPALKQLLVKYSYADDTTQQAMLDELISLWAATAEVTPFEQRIAELSQGGTRLAFSYSWQISLGAPTAKQLEQKALLERVKSMEAFNNSHFFKVDAHKTQEGGRELVELTVRAGAITTGVAKVYEDAEDVYYLTESLLKLAPQQTKYMNLGYQSLRTSIAAALKRQIKPAQAYDDQFAHQEGKAFLVARR